MRLYKTNNHSIADIGRNSQVLYLQDFQEFQSDNVDNKMTQPLQPGLIRDLQELDEAGRAVARFLRQNPGKHRTKEVGEAVRRTISVVNRRLKNLKFSGFVDYVSQPHMNEGMPPSHLYFATDLLMNPEVEKHIALKGEQKLLPSVVEDKPDSSKQTESEQGSNSFTSLENQLSKFRADNRRKYVKLLVTINQHGRLSVRQYAEATGEKPQNLHGCFSRLEKFGTLQRSQMWGKTGRQEYYYGLSPNVHESEIERLAKIYSVSTSEPRETELDMQKTMPHETTSAEQEQKPQVSTTDVLVSKLPEFDPTWPQEVKESWFKSYQQLIDMAKQ